LIKNEEKNAVNMTADVAGVSNVADKSVNKDKGYILGIIVLSAAAIVLFFIRTIILSFLKKSQ